VSGTGMLILFAVVGRRMFRIKDRIPDDGIKWLGNFLWVLALVYLYFMVTEELTASYAAPRADREMAHDVVTGTYAVSFWLVVSCLFFTFLIPFVMYLRGRSSIFWLCVAGVLSNVAAILKRLIIVVPSQTHGGLIQLQKGVYHPSWVEYGVVIGAGGLLMLAVLLFGRWFPLAPTPVDPRRREAHIPRDLPRAFATITWGLASITLIVVGLLDSFRLFSHGEIDPRIKFSPAMFATGVIMLFSTAIVYEAFPERRRGPTARALPGSRTSPRRGLEPGRGIRRVDVKRHLRSSRDLRTRRQP